MIQKHFLKPILRYSRQIWRKEKKPTLSVSHKKNAEQIVTRKEVIGGERKNPDQTPHVWHIFKEVVLTFFLSYVPKRCLGCSSLTGSKRQRNLPWQLSHRAEGERRKEERKAFFLFGGILSFFCLSFQLHCDEWTLATLARELSRLSSSSSSSSFFCSRWYIYFHWLLWQERWLNGFGGESKKKKGQRGNNGGNTQWRLWWLLIHHQKYKKNILLIFVWHKVLGIFSQ